MHNKNLSGISNGKNLYQIIPNEEKWLLYLWGISRSVSQIVFELERLIIFESGRYKRAYIRTHVCASKYLQC